MNDRNPNQPWVGYPHDRGPCSRCCKPFADHLCIESLSLPQNWKACQYFPPAMMATAILARQRVGGTIGTLENIE